MTTEINDDIPSIVEDELKAAQIAGIPEEDRPRYVADRIRFRIGGGWVYVRKGRYKNTERDDEIRMRFTGSNVGALAREFGLTDSRIRQICAK